MSTTRCSLKPVQMFVCYETKHQLRQSRDIWISANRAHPREKSDFEHVCQSSHEQIKNNNATKHSTTFATFYAIWTQSDKTYLLRNSSKETGSIFGYWLSVQVQASKILIHCCLSEVSTSAAVIRSIVSWTRLFLAFDVRRRHYLEQDCRVAAFVACFVLNACFSWCCLREKCVSLHDSGE